MEVFTFLQIPISKEFLLEFLIYLFANTSVRKLFGFRSIMGIRGRPVMSMLGMGLNRGYGVRAGSSSFEEARGRALKPDSG